MLVTCWIFYASKFPLLDFWFLWATASRFSGDSDGMTQQADGSYVAKWGSLREESSDSRWNQGKKGLLQCFHVFFHIGYNILFFASLSIHHSWELFLYPSLITSLTKSASHSDGPENPVTLSGVQMDAGGQDLVVAMISQSAFQCSRIMGGNFKRSCSGVLDDVGPVEPWNLCGGFAGWRKRWKSSLGLCHWWFLSLSSLVFNSGVRNTVPHTIISPGFGCFYSKFNTRKASHELTSIVCYPCPVDTWKDRIWHLWLCIILLQGSSNFPLNNANVW